MIPRLLLIAALAAAGGCAHMEPKERAAYIALNAGLVADVVSTQQGLNAGCVEANPLLGSSPSTAKLVALNAGISYLFWHLSKTQGITWPAWIVAAFRGAVAAHNFREC